MAEFTPITTQEAFEMAVEARVKAAREEAVKPYADYAELKKKADGYEKTLAANTKTINELNAKVHGYEVAGMRSRIARDAGLPDELAGRLSGETEEDVRADAEALAKLWKANTTHASPLASTENHTGSSDRAALRALNAQLNNE